MSDVMVYDHNGISVRVCTSPLLELGATDLCRGGILNPAFARNGVPHIFARGDPEPQKGGSILHFTLSEHGPERRPYIDADKGIAVAPSEDPTAQDCQSVEDPRAFLRRNPRTGQEELYLVSVAWNGKSRPELPDEPPDTRNQLCIAYGPDFSHFERRGIMFDDTPDKDGAIIDIRPDGMTIAARRRMDTEKWMTEIMLASEPTGRYRKVATIPTAYGWTDMRNGVSQFVRYENHYLGMVHGVEETDKGLVYSCGGALLDLEGRLVALEQDPILKPRLDDEVFGLGGKAVTLATGLDRFSNGYGNDMLRVWYGRGDWDIGWAEWPIAEYAAYLLQNPIREVGEGTWELADGRFYRTAQAASAARRPSYHFAG